MGILTGKVAVVTGSTRGLGLAIARAYAAEGAAVIVSSRSAQAVDQTVADFRTRGWKVDGLAADVADLAQVQALASHAVTAFGRIDIWVNNAGITGPYGPTVLYDPRVFAGVVQTNILGTFYGSITALSHFKKQGGGKLINLLGMGYNKPAPMQNAYGSSKVWIRHFTKALAAENKEQVGIGIFALNPGMVLTDLLVRNEVIAGSEDRLKVFPTIVRMWAKPADVPAKKALWLAGPATDGKTGIEGNVFTTDVLVRGALRELWWKVTGKTPKTSDVDMTTVAPWRPD